MADDIVKLTDDDAFFVAAFPLPEDHWVYADEHPPPLTDELISKVHAGIKRGIRESTGNGRIADFDPDAMVLNIAAAMRDVFDLK